MSNLDKYLEATKERILYHVTLTKNVAKIKKNGILLLQTTNYIKGSGERYGHGEIYAFDNFTDAVKWASKMEWDFKVKKPEEISIIKFSAKGKWKVDNNDPLGQAGKKGIWLFSNEKVNAEDVIDIKPLTRDLVKRFVADEDLSSEF